MGAGGGGSSLVVWVGVGAGAGLAVLRGAHGRVAEEAGGALLAQLALGVVQAALIGQRNALMSPIPPWVRKGGVRSGPSYRADARFRVAGVRVAVTLAQLAVAQVQASSGARVSRRTVLGEKPAFPW